MSTDITTEIPRGNAAGFKKYVKQDLTSGFFVFLIALPLCLAISTASGYPPIAGVFTAIIGSIVSTFLSNSELTIKGPAAGLIGITLGCIADFGGDGILTGGWGANDITAYKAALAVGVVAAVFQIFFGLFRAGILGEFFPLSAVHGMLAAIGVIIIAKQVPVVLGVDGGKGGPFALLGRIPEYVATANPAVAVIGIVSVLIMFLWPLVGKKVSFLKRVPSPVIVLLFAVPMGMVFDLMHEHSYTFMSHQFNLSDKYLVAISDKMFGMFDSIATPDFSALRLPMAWKWVFMFFAIGSLESLLSAKAVDLIDPWKRKSSMDRDVVAVGVGNLLVSFIGGLPMISEIVRSRANIDNGAKTRFADFWHGMFLLVSVALIPMVLHRIPTAALAAMLIYTGFRLAHPREFLNVWRIGREQLVVFVVTLVAVLLTDLLIGIGIGIAAKFVIHLANGVPMNSMFKPEVEVVDDDGTTVRMMAYQSAIFSNWILIRRQIERVGLFERKNVTLDLSETKIVDHNVMDKLHEMENDFEQEGLTFQVVGLDEHRGVTAHAQATRKKQMFSIRRLTIITDPKLESQIVAAFLEAGASGYTTIPCSGLGRTQIESGLLHPLPQVRLEVIAPDLICVKLVDYLRRDIQPHNRLTFMLDNVQVSRMNAFVCEDRTTLQGAGAGHH